MKKKMLSMFIQYMLALVMAAASVLYVFAFDAGVLPFMDEDYLQSAVTHKVEVFVPEEEAEDVEEEVVNADFFVNSLPARAGDLYSGIYDGGSCRIVSVPIAPLGNIADGILELRMGYIFKLASDGSMLSVHSGEDGLTDVTKIVNALSLQNLRDGEGRALFYGEGFYFYTENGLTVRTEYDPVNYDKGINYYPAYLAGNDSGCIAFEENNCWGVKNGKGDIVVPAVYRDVYGASEDRIIAVGASGGLYVYSTDGKLLTDSEPKYRIPDSVYKAVEAGDDLPALGCFFYSNGLTRAYTSSGKSVMLTADCKELVLPSGFEIVAYSDGVMLLKQTYKDKEGNEKDLYGYMSAKSKWIANPDYTEARPFYEGLAAVCGADGKWGMIDTEGNAVIPAVFDSISDCQDGIILAYEQKYGNCIFGKTAK